MRTRDILFSVLCHGIACALSAGFLIAFAIATYFICAAIGNDAGGPMVPFLIPLFAVIGGIGMALLVYLPLSILLRWLSRKTRVLFWIAPVLFFHLVFLFFLGWLAFVAKRLPSLSEFGVAALCSLFVTAGFTIYWLVLAVGRSMFRRYEKAD